MGGVRNRTVRAVDGLYRAGFEIGADRIGVVGLVTNKGPWRLHGQIDQRLIGRAVRRFAGREVERDGTASAISETMNFTGEAAPRVPKSSSMNPPCPPAAETWARTAVLSNVVVSALGHRLSESDGHALPDTGGAPSPEAPIDRISVAIFLRHIALARSCAQRP
jgi:hypothetical protein